MAHPKKCPHSLVGDVEYGLSESKMTLIPINQCSISDDETCLEQLYQISVPELILGLRPANGRGRYFVTMSIIGRAQV